MHLRADAIIYVMLRLIITILAAAITLVSVGAPRGDEFDRMYHEFRNYDSRSLSELGGRCIERQHTDSAMAIFTILANRCDGSSVSDDDRKYAVEARLSLGVLNFLQANYASAYSNFLAASRLEGRYDSPGNLNLAAIFLYYGDRPKAYRCLRRVFDASIRSGNEYMASAALINLLTSDFDSTIMPPDTIRSIISDYKKNVPRSPGDKAWPLAHCYSEAKLFSLDKEHEKAITMLRASLDSAQRLLMPQREYFASYIALGNKYRDVGNPDSAEFFLRKAESIAKENAYPELLISVYSDLSRLYQSTGQNDLAAKYRFKHLELHDSVFSAREYGNIHDLELFDETTKFEQRIKRIQIEEKMRSRVIMVIACALLLLAIMTTILFVQNRKLRLKNKSLFDRNLEIMTSDTIEVSQPEKPSATSGPSGDIRSHISECIRKAMTDESVFCMEGFSMRELTEICGSNQKYVSQVLNEDYGKTFTQLLNERRINVARRRLLDFEQYGHLTIEAIVTGLGFKSRSTFSKTFKRMTGLTPSEFQHMAQENIAKGTSSRESDPNHEGD